MEDLTFNDVWMKARITEDMHVEVSYMCRTCSDNNEVMQFISGSKEGHIMAGN